MSNPKSDFPTVIKTSIPSITKHPQNISLNSKHNTNQYRITFKSDISKFHILNFLHSKYNFIKLNNHSSLNFKKRRENIDKLIHTNETFNFFRFQIQVLQIKKAMKKNYTSEKNNHKLI